MSRIEGVLYNLKRHRFIGWSLLRWFRAITLAMGVCLAIAHTSIWLVAIVFGLLVASALLEVTAERRNYVDFVPSHEAPPDPLALPPEEKIHLRATGHFGVEGKWKRFLDLEAYFRTFRNREHAIMAWVPPSRYLFLGNWPKEDLGLWYIFFEEEHILEITPGTVGVFGKKERGLRLRYIEPQSRKKKTAESVVFMSFASPEEMRAVWADLIWDSAERQPG